MLKRKSQKKFKIVTMATGVLPSQGHQPATPRAPGSRALLLMMRCWCSLLFWTLHRKLRQTACWLLSQTVCTAPCTQERTEKSSEKADKREQWNAAWSEQQRVPAVPAWAWEEARREGQPQTNRGPRALPNKRPLTSFLPWLNTAGSGSSVPGPQRARPALAEQEVLVNRHLVPEPITARGQQGTSAATSGAHGLGREPAAVLPLSTVNGRQGRFGPAAGGCLQRAALTCPGGGRPRPASPTLHSQGLLRVDPVLGMGGPVPVTPGPRRITGRRPEEPPVRSRSDQTQVWAGTSRVSRRRSSANPGRQSRSPQHLPPPGRGAEVGCGVCPLCHWHRFPPPAQVSSAPLLPATDSGYGP